MNRGNTSTVEPGAKFGRLTVMSPEASSGGKGYWKCRCECGSEKRVRASNLRSGTTSSCGCLARELSATRAALRRENLTGKVFGFYTVLSFDRTEGRTTSGGGATYWNCRCRCGHEKSVAALHLRNSSNPKCRACANAELERDNWHIIRLLHRYRRGADERGFRFLLTRAQFEELIGQPCHYCGAVRADELRHERQPHRTYRHNGIDRFDNAGDYTPDNSVSCCWTCNRMKSAASGFDFIQHCKTIAARF